MNVLVVNPYVTDFKLYDEWMHPLGLYFLIDVLAANTVNVHYFNCIDRPTGGTAKKYGTGTITSTEISRPADFGDIRRKYKLYGIEVERFRKYLDSLSPPDAVFIGSMMTYWAEGLLRTIGIVREAFPGVPVICGGIAVQLMPEYFRGQVEDVFFFDGSLLSDAGGTVELPGFPLRLSLPKVPSLLPAFIKVSPQYHGPVLLSLGCPLRCSYCASAALQPFYRRRPAGVVRDETEYLIEEKGIRDLAFYDDALLVDAPEVLVPFLQWIIGKSVRVRLHTPNGLHLKYATEELLVLMRDAGFTTVRFGYESGDSRYRLTTGGKADRRLLTEKLHLLQRIRFPDAGIYVMGGLPESRPEEVVREMRHIASFGIAVKPVFLSPVPGTPLFTEYREKIQMLTDDPCWHNDTIFTARLAGWGREGVEMVRSCAKELNRSL